MRYGVLTFILDFLSFEVCAFCIESIFSFFSFQSIDLDWPPKVDAPLDGVIDETKEMSDIEPNEEANNGD